MAAAVLGGILLAGCAAQEGPVRGIRLIEAQAGGAAGDEFYAVVVASSILGMKGSAADAAVAWFFTAAVTNPGAVALGAGGACIAYDVEKNAAEVIEFPIGAPTKTFPGAHVGNGVPGAVRGLFALHARYGKLPWTKILIPAEQIARLGHPVSRALAHRLALASGSPNGNGEIARMFAREDGLPLRKGDILVQLDLAAVLAQIRTQGSDVFYTGDLARKLADAVAEIGGSLSIEDLRDYRSVWTDTLQIRDRGIRIHTIPPPSSAGLGLLQMWAMITQDDRYEDAGADERAHLIAEVSMRASASGGRYAVNGGGSYDTSLDDDRIDRLMAGYQPDKHVFVDSSFRQPVENPANPVASTFVAVDTQGSAVACLVSLNRMFGVGRVAPGTGIVIGAAPGTTPEETAAPAPVIVVDHNLRNFIFAGAASGGASASSALVATMAKTMIEKVPLPEALAAPRFYHAGFPDVVVFEPGESAKRLAALRRRGHTLTQGPALGRVNAIACGDGFWGNPEPCQYGTDPRGYGFAKVAQF